MKRLTILGFLGIWVLVVGCSGWTYNGIRGEDLRHPSTKLVAGTFTTFAAHTLGHLAYCQLTGRDWHFKGLSETIDEELSDSEAAWFGRAGFVSQLAVGYVLRGIGMDEEFMRGYTAGTVIEIATYPVWQFARGEGDDLGLIDRGSNANLEWGIYSGLAIGMNFKCEGEGKREGE